MPPSDAIRPGRPPAADATPSYARDRACSRRELRRLRRAQGLAAAAPRGGRGGPVHRGAADAGDGAAGRDARQDREDHDPGPGRAVPEGQGEPAVQRGLARPALGQRLHLRGDMAGLRPRRLRHRRLRAADRRLAGQPDGHRRLRARRPRTSDPPAPAREGHGARRTLRQGQPISRHPVHRAPGRGRHRRCCHERGGDLGLA